MPKPKPDTSEFKGWRYVCLTCGYTTLSVKDAVEHIKKNKDHQLSRQEL